MIADRHLALCRRWGARVQRYDRQWICALMRASCTAGIGATPEAAITDALRRAGLIL
jgi:hypothetical protein